MYTLYVDKWESLVMIFCLQIVEKNGVREFIEIFGALKS